MQACLILLTLAASPSTTQVVSPQTVNQRLVALGDFLERWQNVSIGTLQMLLENSVDSVTESHLAVALIKVSDQVIQNFTSQLLLQCNSSQLLIDLKVLKSRQAVAGAIQGAQVFMFLAYLVTIAVCYLVKHCRKQQEEIAKADFELLETKLQASRSRRRAAAAARTNKQTPQ